MRCKIVKEIKIKVIGKYASATLISMFLYLFLTSPKPSN